MLLSQQSVLPFAQIQFLKAFVALGADYFTFGGNYFPSAANLYPLMNQGKKFYG